MDYTTRRAARPLGTPTAHGDHALWAGADELSVTDYPWKDSGHRPGVRARVLWDDGFLAVRFEVDDRYVRAVAQMWNDSVCSDSCVEFFVAPDADPTRDAYFNFEINCGGTMLLYRCPSTAEADAGVGRLHLDAAEGALLRVAATLPKVIEPEMAGPIDWSVECCVPWSLFERHFGVDRPEPGTMWRGNFYKCGDHTSHPHWGSWAPMNAPTGFHQPAYFRPLLFV